MLRSLSYIDTMLRLRRSYKFYQVRNFRNSIIEPSLTAVKIKTNENDQLPFDSILPRVLLPLMLVSALLAEDIL